MDNLELLNTLRPLTQEERQTAQTAARAAVIRAAGDRPERKAFQRELGSIFTLLDYLALVVFVPALIVSSVHIIYHMGMLAAASYAPVTTEVTGTVINGSLYIAIHQWALIPLAEASMLLFLVMYAMNGETRRKYVYLALAGAALLFVAIANLKSGIAFFESVLPAIFTIGVGFHLETLIVRQLKRRDEINSRYLEALHSWEVATANPEQHKEYMQRYANALKDALTRANARRAAFKDLTVAQWRLLVKREIAADNWYGDDVDLPTGGANPLPLAESVVNHSGNIPPTLVDHASIQPMPYDNGHTVPVNVTK